MQLKDRLYQYLLKKGDIIDNEYNEHLQYYRYRKCDEVDYLESIIRKVRRDTYNEVKQDLIHIINNQRLYNEKK